MLERWMMVLSEGWENELINGRGTGGQRKRIQFEGAGLQEMVFRASNDAPSERAVQSVHHFEPEIVVLETRGHISIKIRTMIVPLWIMIDFEVSTGTGRTFQMKFFQNLIDKV